jgi:eukaryotic-like serine/threonine-protein kinase
MGPYRLTGRLGGGGMGEVYLGRSAGGRAVAVKVIRAELAADPEFRARFRHEVAAARSVNGIYTALVADADADGPVPWLATAYVPGPSLADAVGLHGPLPARSVLALAAGLAEGLSAIHAAGLVHRDLKPSNVLLADDGPRVIDFGISRTAEATVLTSAGYVLGSPGFMSPEQAVGRPVGPSSDVFSLGAVLTFAATGEGPFGGGATPALLYRIVNGEPELSRVPPDVRPLVRRCLAKDPATRPASGELLAELADVQPWSDWLPEYVLAGQDAGGWTPPRGQAPRAASPARADFAELPVTASRPAVTPEPEVTQTVATPPSGQSRSGRVPPPDQLAPPDQPAPPDQAAPPEHDGKPRRRTRRRTLAAAGLAIVAAGGASALTLGSHGGTPSASRGSQPPRTTGGGTPTASPYRFVVSGARAHSCTAGSRSVGGRRGAQVVFTDKSSAGLQLFWLDFDGNRKLYVKLKPGGSQRMETYVGDYWLIADSSGGCIGVFDVTGNGQIAVEKA